jgi:hypothetical protein
MDRRAPAEKGHPESQVQYGGAACYWPFSFGFPAFFMYAMMYSTPMPAGAVQLQGSLDSPGHNYQLAVKKNVSISANFHLSRS